MEEKVKKLIYIFLIILVSIFLIYFFVNLKNYAVSIDENNSSDIQLMARAINRRSKRRIL